MDKKWSIESANEQDAAHLQEVLKINPTLCRLLVQRGITTFDEAKKFFRPSLDHLHDPFLMKDMDKAVERVDTAMRNREKILIYGDYDVDGTTSVALVYSFFKEFYFFLDYYIPDRYEEGYGISYQAIDWAKENGFSLIIALDCGIKAIDKVKYANEQNIDFIICDHHRPGEILPPAYAVLDPKRKDCPYPFKELSGCGIGFKLVQAFATKKDISFKKVYKLLDLVVVSIAADIVPMDDENRVLAHFGLKLLNKSPRPGLRSLIEVTSLTRQITISDIIFIIAPRINAAGRLDDAKHSVRLLVSQEGVSAKENANVLQEKNRERKQIDADITESAFSMFDTYPELLDRKATVLYQPDWHKGVIGIVASRLIEKYFRPTIVMTLSNGEVAGSARSVPGFDVYNAIKACSQYLDQFGGHKYAAGLTLKEENVVPFMKMFEKVVADTIEDHMLIPQINIASELNLSDITPNFYRILKQFAPFGPTNKQPIFVSTGLQDSGYSSIVGKKHLKVVARQNGSRTVKGIGFNMADSYKELIKNNTFDLCYTLEENRYNGNVSLQMNIKDIKPSVGATYVQEGLRAVE